MSNVHLAEEFEPNPPLEEEDFEDEAPPAASWIVAFVNHAAVKAGVTIGVALLALGFLVLKGPFSAPNTASERELALAAPPAPSPAPSPAPIVTAPPIVAETVTPVAPAPPTDAVTAQSVDPNPTGAIAPPKKHKHKSKKPKPTPTPAPT